MSLRTCLLVVFLAFPLAQAATVEEQGCQIEMLGFVDSYPPFIFYAGDDVAPFTGWTYTNFTKKDGFMVNTISSVRQIEGTGCSHCKITLFSSNTSSGENVTYSFKDENKFELPFDALSLSLDCEGEEPIEQYEAVSGSEVHSERLEKLRETGYIKAYEAAETAKRLIEEGNYSVSFSGVALRSVVNSDKYMFGYFFRASKKPEYLLMFDVFESSGKLVSWKLEPVAAE